MAGSGVVNDGVCGGSSGRGTVADGDGGGGTGDGFNSAITVTVSSGVITIDAPVVTLRLQKGHVKGEKEDR